MCEKAVTLVLFVLKNCFDKYRSQEMCQEAVGVCLPFLRFVPDWFDSNKYFFNKDIVFVNKDSDNCLKKQPPEVSFKESCS